MPSHIKSVTHGDRWPNIHVCGNPGTGKTTLAKNVAAAVDSLQYLDLGSEGRKRGCIVSRDEVLESDVLDYEKLHDALLPLMQKGGSIVDWIHGDIWDPPSLVDLVVVLTCDNTLLYDRYVARGYNARKIEQNIDSEIMQVIVSETRDYYQGSSDDDADENKRSPDILVLKSDDDADMAANVEKLTKWVEQWRRG